MCYFEFVLLLYISLVLVNPYKTGASPWSDLLDLPASEKLAAAQEFNAARNDASTVREQELIKKCSDLEFHLKTKQDIDQSMEVAAGGCDGGVRTENYQHEIRDSKNISSMDTKIEKQRQRVRSQTQNHHVWGGRILVPSFLEEDEGY